MTKWNNLGKYVTHPRPKILLFKMKLLQIIAGKKSQVHLIPPSGSSETTEAQRGEVVCN